MTTELILECQPPTPASPSLPHSPSPSHKICNVAHPSIDNFDQSSTPVSYPAGSTFLSTRIPSRSGSCSPLKRRRQDLSDGEPSPGDSPELEQRTTTKGGGQQSGKSSRASTPSSKSSKTSLSKERMYACLYPGCEKSYTKPSRLAEHERAHSDDRPYKCQTPGCEASFRREYHLMTHLRSHGSTREFKCFQPGCNKAFYAKDKLARHLKIHTELTFAIPSTPTLSDIKSDTSQERGQPSLSLEAMQRVAEQIAKEKPYPCTWEGCLQRFSKRQKVKAHICMAHEGRKPYPCTHEGCNKSFQTPSKLRKHQLVHSDALRYGCGYPGCETYYSKWSLLQKHAKACHKSMPCSVCGKMVLRNNMNAHIKIHDATRPVVPCTYDECTKVFSTERTLATHIKTVHLKSPDAPKFKCDHEGCDKGFEFKHVLERHVREVHMAPKYPRKKRSDAIESSGVLDDVFGFTEEDAEVKMPFACPVSDCERRFTSERLMRRHLNGKRHRTGDVTGADAIKSMEDAENWAIRDMIEMHLGGTDADS